ncbi:hypothetical protein Glove_655g3 [Diversispora epigaea]|uniref:Galactose oxidase n=1 Tax=Diversispora epigaea TaxID=1348612 RepID=A0A397G7D1_9GLOM|nr:hypothetical protein Glove_655g3 [Diversispora epigaea]
MNILNTVSNTWTTLSISGDLPTACSEYTADILPSGIIVYIGGITEISAYTTGFTLVNINRIKLFDTNTYEWSQMNATGDQIDSRMYFYSVLTPDGYIIIFGGSTYARKNADLSSVNPKLAIVVTTESWKGGTKISIELALVLPVYTVEGKIPLLHLLTYLSDYIHDFVVLPKRFLHNSVIIDDKLLVISGYTNVTDYTYELFYLDLSTSFENNKLTWTLIPEGSLPVYTWRSTAVLSLDNSTIYLYGGFMTNKDTHDYDYSNLVYTYDYSTSTWSIPNLGGDTVSPRQDMKGVIDNSGKIYIFGGFNATNLASFTGFLFNDMNVLNTASNTWTTLSISGSLPNRCFHYTADILPNGIIVYIGGAEQVSVGGNFALVDINNIKLFDTSNLEWSQKDATGDVIDSRMYFSSVLTPDGYIIIFGGCTYAPGSDFSSVSPKLASLNTDTFEWSIPSDSDMNSLPSIYGHAANLYNDFMIITFGFDLDTQLFSPSSQVYLYNIKSDKWVTTFSPNENKPTTSTTITSTNKPIITTSPTKKSSKSLAIGLGVGISAAVLITCITFIVCKTKQSVKDRKQTNQNRQKVFNKWVTTFSLTDNKPTATTTSSTSLQAEKSSKLFLTDNKPTATTTSSTSLQAEKSSKLL